MVSDASVLVAANQARESEALEVDVTAEVATAGEHMAAARRGAEVMAAASWVEAAGRVETAVVVVRGVVLVLKGRKDLVIWMNFRSVVKCNEMYEEI